MWCVAVAMCGWEGVGKGRLFWVWLSGVVSCWVVVCVWCGVCVECGVVECRVVVVW